jgi:hypothetical protein
MTTVNLSPVHDTYVTDYTPNTAPSQAGNVAKLIVSFNGRDQEGEQRTWVRFDLSSIPAGSTINSATLRFYIYFSINPSYGGQDIGVFKSTNITWTESLTWNTQPSTSGTATDSDWLSWTGDWDFTVTSDVSSELSNGGVTWCMKAVNTGQFSDFYEWLMQDDDYTTGPPTNDRPILIVDYTPPVTFKPQTVWMM